MFAQPTNQRLPIDRVLHLVAIGCDTHTHTDTDTPNTQSKEPCSCPSSFTPPLSNTQVGKAFWRKQQQLLSEKKIKNGVPFLFRKTQPNLREGKMQVSLPSKGDRKRKRTFDLFLGVCVCVCIYIPADPIYIYIKPRKRRSCPVRRHTHGGGGKPYLKQLSFSNGRESIYSLRSICFLS